MSAVPSRRIHPAWLILALAVTLVAAYFAPEADQGGVVLSERAAAAPRSVATAASTPVAASAIASPPMSPRSMSLAGANARVLSVAKREPFTGDDALFKGPAVASPQPARVPVAPLPPAVTPSSVDVPRLPLKMIGRYVDNGAPAAFVIMQDQSLVLRVGDAVADQFRVELIDEVSLTVRHLPTEQRQSFRLDGAP